MGNGRFYRIAIIAALALLGASVAQPYVTRLLLSETAPRAVTPRGDLSDAEQSITALFERVSPSVVQVVGRQGGRNVFDEDSAGVQSGTGFVWDGAGNTGGPLLDSGGRVVGVNTAIISPSGSNAGVGFAIPIDIVNRVVPQLIRDGHVPTPGIGIVAASEQDATRLGVDGIPILRTLPNTPAARRPA